MGKTVQAITFVLTQRELQKATSDSSILSSLHSTSQEILAVKGTLVVCPVVGALQWFCEIEHRTKEGSNKTLVYHGSNRENFLYKLSKYDFVITTYSTIEADYRTKKSKKNSKNSKPQVEISAKKLNDDGFADKSIRVDEDMP
ncbi:hypothetical protein FXO38_18358 [Capsicum annuum]|uniref:SNF2 N-terminal domain-containing protein n=1 Tax=Capsicum annuum TaxID=4072 RepID=A0A2G2Z369_CAPAN|nr:hypothetical protein FXO38_18358 [Capsicum annuum]KAF3666362.1 hypothetical protein FXO37_10594 [Capsicum annuum]PHT76419.1 hypothetical protein T459_19941 [Capsicum annuum]